MKKSVLIIVLSLILLNFVCASEFSVDSVLVKTSMKVNQDAANYVKIVNGLDKQDFAASADFSQAGIEDKTFTLEPKQEKVLKINFLSNEAGIFSGYLSINDKLIPAMLEVESDTALFDAQIALPNKKIFSGNDVLVEIKIYDLYRVGVSDVEIEYFAKDFNGEVIYSGKESIVVKDSASVIKTMSLSGDTKEGDYYFGAIVSYKDSTGTSTEYFSVLSKEQGYLSFFINNSIVIGIGILILFLILVIFVYVKLDRRKLKNVVQNQNVQINEISKKVKKKISEKDACDADNKLKKQQDLLRRAFDEKYISKESYQKGMKRLEGMRKKVRRNIK